MFLTKEELIGLTGYKVGKLQIKWLIEHGYKFDIRASGLPTVLKAHIDNKLGGFGHLAKKQEQPDFSNKAIFG